MGLLSVVFPKHTSLESFSLAERVGERVDERRVRGGGDCGHKHA